MGFPGGSDGKESAYNAGDLGIEPASLTSPALAGGFFTTSATWEDPLEGIPHN